MIMNVKCCREIMIIQVEKEELKEKKYFPSLMRMNTHLNPIYIYITKMNKNKMKRIIVIKFNYNHSKLIGYQISRQPEQTINETKKKNGNKILL